MKNKLISLFTAVLLLSGIFIISASAAEEGKTDRITSSMEAFMENDGRIIGVSSKGEWDFFPENSIAAITEAAKTDIDFVLTDIKKTSDGVLIAFSDDTTERMLSCDTVYEIAKTEFSVLEGHFLRYSCGGVSADASDCKIPSLKEVIDTAKTCDIPLILRCSADIIPAVTKELIENEAMSMCIIMTDASAKDLKNALDNCAEKPYIIGSKKGNVIFAMNSYVNNLEKMDALGVDLKTSNRYGINYYKSVVGDYSEKMRVIADPTTPEVCGAREDSEKWWNDLISRGYSVIITDFPELFSDYIRRNNDARSRLENLYVEHVNEKQLPQGFNKIMLNDYKKAYTDAVAFADSIIGDNSVSLQELNDCIFALTKASNDISIHFNALEDGSSGTTITVPRIILCVIAVVAVIVVQVYFFKRRKKEG